MNKKLKRMLGAVLAFSALLCALLVLNAVSVFASTTTIYNFAEITNDITAYVSDTGLCGSSSLSTQLSADTVLTFSEDKPNTITMLKSGKPVYADYSEVSGCLTTAPGSGTLSDTVLTHTFYANATGVSLLTISDIAANDTVEIYYIGCDSKGSLNKTTTIGVCMNSGTVTTYEVTKSATTPSYASYEASEAGTLTISEQLGSNRLAVCAIVVTTGNEAVAKTTVSGSVPSELAASGNITFSTDDGSSYSAEISSNSYSVELPQSTTYTISLDTNSDYIKSQYTLATTSLTTGTDETQTLNLTAGDKITSWDFSSLPSYTIQGTTGTYKGIYVDASSGKFDAQPSNNRVQFNFGTIAYVPISAGEKVDVTVSNGYTIVYYNDYAKITSVQTDTNNNNNYITAIKIVTGTPALTLSASTNALTAAVSNVSEENEIQSIVVRKASETEGTAITKIKEDGGSYSFTAKFNDSRDEAVNGEIDLVYASGDSTETAVYGFTLATDGTVTVTAGI